MRLEPAPGIPQLGAGSLFLSYLLTTKRGREDNRVMTQDEFDQARESWRERERERQERHDSWLAWLDDNPIPSR